MEKLSVNQKSPKQAKATKKKPIKVVYISNPMKVEASPADFRAVVQELTGQDSDAADISKFPSIAATEHAQAAPQSISRAADGLGHLPANPGADHTADRYNSAYKSVDTPFEMFDEAFNGQMLENFPGFTPSAAYYEPQGDTSRNHDAM